MKHWCRSCKKYVCRDCARGPHYKPLCPECGDRIYKITPWIFLYLLASSLLILSLFVALVLIELYQHGNFGDIHPTVWEIFRIFLGYSIGTVILWFIVRKRNRHHDEHIVRLPEGTIPPEKRPGYGDPALEEKILKKKPGRGILGFMKPYGDTTFIGLMGDWDFPILLKEERKVEGARLKRIAILTLIAAVIGAVFAVTGLLKVMPFPWDVLSLGIGAAVSLSSFLLLFFIGDRYVGLGKDAHAETKVRWKTVGEERMVEAVEDFLRENRMKYRKTVSGIPGEFKIYWYFLSKNGICIMTSYFDKEPSTRWGYLTLRYGSGDCNQARKIQKDLDIFLTRLDLINKRI